MRKKRSNVALEVKTFDGGSGTRYLVFRTPDDRFHVFAETEAKAAAKDCGGEGRHTRDYWRSLWNTGSSLQD